MKPLVLFYLLVVYVLLQFSWWAYLLVDLNTEVYQYKTEITAIKHPNAITKAKHQDELLAKLHERWMMVASEGVVFLGLLIIGINQTRKAFRKEYMLSMQQKNFLLSVTHEFKSPLAAIKLSLQTLEKHNLDAEKTQSIIARSLNETERINNLIENALMAAPIQ